MATWHEQLRELRCSRLLNRTDLAALSGISLESIRSYETGRRRPPGHRLSQLLDALKADVRSRNAIYAAIGLMVPLPDNPFALEDMSLAAASQLIHERPLPAFLMNHRTEFVTLNPSAASLLRIPTPPPGRRNVRHVSALTLTTRRAMAERLENWDFLMAVMIAAFKRAAPEPESLDAPMLEALTAGDPALVRRFSELWSTTRAWRGRLSGPSYPVIWKALAGGKIHFHCIVHCVNRVEGFYVHDWMPKDVNSHRLLEESLTT